MWIGRQYDESARRSSARSRDLEKVGVGVERRDDDDGGVDGRANAHGTSCILHRVRREVAPMARAGRREGGFHKRGKVSLASSDPTTVRAGKSVGACTRTTRSVYLTKTR
jgi:hypothetical protein